MHHVTRVGRAGGRRRKIRDALRSLQGAIHRHVRSDARGVPSRPRTGEALQARRARGGSAAAPRLDRIARPAARAGSTLSPAGAARACLYATALRGAPALRGVRLRVPARGPAGCRVGRASRGADREGPCGVHGRSSLAAREGSGGRPGLRASGFKPGRCKEAGRARLLALGRDHELRRPHRRVGCLPLSGDRAGTGRPRPDRSSQPRFTRAEARGSAPARGTDRVPRSGMAHRRGERGRARRAYRSRQRHGRTGRGRFFHVARRSPGLVAAPSPRAAPRRRGLRGAAG